MRCATSEKTARNRRIQARARALLALLGVLCALLAGCAPPWASHTPPRTLGDHTPTPTLSPAAYQGCPAWDTAPTPTLPTAPASGDLASIAAANAQAVLQTTRPIRNLYSITQRLVNRSAQAIPCRVRDTPRDERVGQTATFYVTNPTMTGYHQITATLVYVTPHIYMYVQNGASANLQALTDAANTFEQHSYPKDVATYGPPWTPGPDDDQHITVLNARNLGPVGGYFSSEDEYPRSVSPYSNERQMIYVNLDGGEVPGSPGYDATLAHEFQHMIHWYWHPNDGSWTNEGMSVLAQHLNGYSDSGVGPVFLRTPDTMLGGWTDDQNADIAHYGAAYLFLDYWFEHEGGAAAMRQLLTDPKQTPLNFDDVLAAQGSKQTFDDVFAQFVLANVLNDPTLAGGIYSYPTIPDQTAKIQHTVTTYPYRAGTSTQPATVNQYAAEYYDFRPSPGSSAVSVVFQGSPLTHIIDNAPYSGARTEWWSNTGNDMDSTLTRLFDLSRLEGKSATLTFQAWYSLEQDFDYGYVEVSTDGGTTWKTLRATTSTSTNPNGANLGNGLTGTSSATGQTQDLHCGPTPEWVPESVDLSAYAGKHILVRFETITDDAVHCPGLAIDNISIPQLGFYDANGSDPGWQASGWLHSDNTLAQRFVVQAVVYSGNGAPPKIEQVPVNALGAATYTASGLGAGGHVVLVVTAMAPGTVIPAQYSLTAG